MTITSSLRETVIELKLNSRSFKRELRAVKRLLDRFREEAQRPIELRISESINRDLDNFLTKFRSVGARIARNTDRLRRAFDSGQIDSVRRRIEPKSTVPPRIAYEPGGSGSGSGGGGGNIPSDGDARNFPSGYDINREIFTKIKDATDYLVDGLRSVLAGAFQQLAGYRNLGGLLRKYMFGVMGNEWLQNSHSGPRSVGSPSRNISRVLARGRSLALTTSAMANDTVSEENYGGPNYFPGTGRWRVASSKNIFGDEDYEIVHSFMNSLWELRARLDEASAVIARKILPALQKIFDSIGPGWAKFLTELFLASRVLGFLIKPVKLLLDALAIAKISRIAGLFGDGLAGSLRTASETAMLLNSKILLVVGALTALGTAVYFLAKKFGFISEKGGKNKGGGNVYSRILDNFGFYEDTKDLIRRRNNAFPQVNNLMPQPQSNTTNNNSSQTTYNIGQISVNSDASNMSELMSDIETSAGRGRNTFLMQNSNYGAVY